MWPKRIQISSSFDLCIRYHGISACSNFKRPYEEYNVFLTLCSSIAEVPKPKISIIDQAKIGGFTQRFSCTASSRYPSYVKATVDFRLIHDGKIVGRPVYPAQPNGNNTIIQGFLSENKPGTYWCRVEIQSGTLSSCKGITHQDSTNKISIPLKHPTPSPKPMRTEKQTMTYEIAASPTPMATSSTAMSTSPTAHRPMKDEIEEKDPLHVALAPGIIGSLGMITIAIVLSCKAYRVYTHRTMKKGVSATEAPGMYEPTLSLSDKSDSSSFNETPPFHPPRLVRVHQASKDDTTISPFVVLPATSHSSPTDLSKLAGEQGHTGAPYTYPQATASHSRVQQHSPNEGEIDQHKRNWSMISQQMFPSGQAEDGSFSTQVWMIIGQQSRLVISISSCHEPSNQFLTCTVKVMISMATNT